MPGGFFFLLPIPFFIYFLKQKEIVAPNAISNNVYSRMAHTSKRVSKIASKELRGKKVGPKGRKSVAGAALRERRRGR
jgi:hypothetical protein